MNVAWRNHIESDPKVLRGKPRIKGTRIPVSLILGCLATGYSPQQIIAEFPTSTKSRLLPAWTTPVNWRNSKWPSDERGSDRG